MAERETGERREEEGLPFRAEKRPAQASAHPLSQAQGGLFCVLTCVDLVLTASGRKNVISMRELFCPDPLAGFEKMAGFQMFYCLNITCFHS